ncbi:MAG: hypothetical protein O2888_03000 [Chloroflexi bacterium]|nr:hypothetical protein [Chloroflexota bacterium]
MISRIQALSIGSAATLLMAVFIATSGTTTVSAQSASAEWAFAPRGFFGDERVVQSMRLQMNTDAAATAGGVSLGYFNGAELFAPSEDALILLMAAGLLGHEQTQVVGVTTSRECRVWSGGSEGAEAEALAATATILGEELARVWGDLGVSLAPCEVTGDPVQADLLVFPAGQPPAEVDFMAYQSEGSFLSYPQTPQPGAGGGSDCPQGFGCVPGQAGGPLAAVTGSLGPSQDGATAAQLALASAVVFGIVAWARRTTRHEER